MPDRKRRMLVLGIGTRLWLSRSSHDGEISLVAIDRSPVDAVILSAAGGIHARMAERIAELPFELPTRCIR
jgi:hypothetical protein